MDVNASYEWGCLGARLDMEFDFRPYGGDGPKWSVLLDPSLWRFLRTQKDLNPELLRWFLLLQQFEFEVRDKG